MIRETIKKRPVDKRKVFRNMLTTVLLAVLFGAVASVTFYLLEPVINRNISPEQEAPPGRVTLPESGYEITPDKMVEDDEELKEASESPQDLDVESVVERAIRRSTIGIDEYKQLYSSLNVLSSDIRRSMVTITSVNSNVDWLNNPVESENVMEGVIIADNDTWLYAAAAGALPSDSKEISGTFFDGSTAEAELTGYDSHTGIFVVSVKKDALSEETLKEVKTAVLLSTDTLSIRGRPVIAIGSLTSTPGAVEYGIISSADRMLDIPDSLCRILVTDMPGSAQSNGVIFDLNGSVAGFISRGNESDPDPGVITALSSAGVRGIINKLTNQEKRIVLGIHAIDVPASAVSEEGVPEGVAVTQVEIGSPAMEAGLRSGDIIITAKGNAVKSYSELLFILDNSHPGDTMVITAMRPGRDDYESTRVEVTLGGTE